MDSTNFKNELYSAFEKNNISQYYTESGADMFFEFAQLLISANKSMNLTAITDEIDIIYKHFVDCAMLAPYIPKNSCVIDVGCGGGFPTLPLAIVRPDINITALDSTAKKIVFVQSVCDKLRIVNVTAISDRAEEYVLSHREKFDVCVSRAVASLPVLCELCLSFIKVGGLFLPMKGSKMPDELLLSENGIKMLGGSVTDNKSFQLKTSYVVMDRYVAVIKKISHTPSKYPRKYVQILKNPL